MGWKPGKYLGKAIKSIGRGIKKIGKGIGKAFKKVFKGIGNFIGKLGPIGMLGMMLLMPQLGAWWGQFGTWADTLVSGGKFFGHVMKGIHTVGASIGTAYTKVTDGINMVFDKISGGNWSKMTEWMGQKMDSAREFLGLETQQGLQASKAAEALNLPEGVQELPEGWSVHEGQFKAGQHGTKIGEDKIWLRGPDGNLYVEGSTRFNFEIKSDLASRAGTLEQYISDPSAYEYVYTPDGKYSRNLEWQKGTGAGVGTGAGAGAEKGLSRLEKVGLGVSTATGTVNLLQTAAGYDDDAYGYGGFIADVSVPLYDSYQSAQTDWTNQGFAGTPSFGAGSPGYFQSVVNSFRDDPWYMYMQRPQQV